MVRVSGGEIKRIGEFEDFYMDRFEVTNRQYREFVLKGGYQKRDYWKYRLQQGREASDLGTSHGRIRRQDRPARAGNVAGGRLPRRRGRLSGIRNQLVRSVRLRRIIRARRLPSGSHWGIAKGDLTNLYSSFRFFIPFYIPQSNFKRKGPEPVGHNPAITVYELYDMAGNVREWCFNETRMGRLVRGGAWEDVPYMFSNSSQLSPFDRSPKNGFRCCSLQSPGEGSPGRSGSGRNSEHARARLPKPEARI